MAKVKLGKFEVEEPELERQHEAAVQRGKERMATEPQASAVKYDRQSNRLVIDLKNGTTFIVPCDLVQGLRGVAPDDIAEVELLPRGAALHWEKLDVDISLAGLMFGIFGTKAWMAEIGRRGGSATSEAKAIAVRANGSKGGRPRRPAKQRPRL
jgi:hypothetical protein